MIYVVNVDIELEAATPELAEDAVVDLLSENTKDWFIAIKKVEQIV